MAEVWQQDWIARWALYSPNKVVLEEHSTGRVITYGGLNSLANGITHYLNENFGIKKGDIIAVISEFSISYVALFSAAQKMGFTIVPMNYRLSQAETTSILNNCQPKIIFYESKFELLFQENFALISHDLVAFDKIETFSEPFSNVVCQDDPIFIIYTSGTTGYPKGVLYTHKMAFWNSINTSISLRINTESRSLNVMPPFHTGGWNVLLLPFLHHGGFMYLCKKFEPSVVLNKISDLKCTLFMGVPTMLSMMAQVDEFETSDLTSLYYIIVGGEAMPISLIERYGHKNVAIRQGYGMTEVGPNLTSLHQDDAIHKKGSIGRPNFYVEYKIINESLQECQANEPGELWLRGPMVTPGYLNNPLETQKAFSDDGLWFRTGDVVIEDDEKYLFIVDRIKNMYISGGENVYPVEVEKVLLTLESIKEVAVIGVKDFKWGETGRAFIVYHEDKMKYLKEELVEYCENRLAKFKIPKYFQEIAALPKTDSGKIDRKRLKSIISSD